MLAVLIVVVLMLMAMATAIAATAALRGSKDTHGSRWHILRWWWYRWRWPWHDKRFCQNHWRLEPCFWRDILQLLGTFFEIDCRTTGVIAKVKDMGEAARSISQSWSASSCDQVDLMGKNCAQIDWLTTRDKWKEKWSSISQIRNFRVPKRFKGFREVNLKTISHGWYQVWKRIYRVVGKKCLNQLCRAILEDRESEDNFSKS